MSEAFEIVLLATVFLFQVGQKIARVQSQKDATVSEEYPAYERHLRGQRTQIADGQLLRQLLDQLKLEYQEGDPDHHWGTSIDLQVFDEEGQPWFALAQDEESQAYSIYSFDPDYSQNDLPPEMRLSEKDPTDVLGQLAQQYGYLKTLRTLLQSGYEMKGTTEQHPDGSQVITLQKTDSHSGELLTVRLVFKPCGGQMTVLTDSQRTDGSHGVCPDLDPLLHSIGIAQYEKWISPAARQAKERDRRARLQDSATRDEDFRPPTLRERRR